jgi:hypothetical protein
VTLNHSYSSSGNASDGRENGHVSVPCLSNFCVCGSSTMLYHDGFSCCVYRHDFLLILIVVGPPLSQKWERSLSTSIVSRKRSRIQFPLFLDGHYVTV